MENNVYSINQIMTIVEASERFGVNQDTLKNKFKPSVAGRDKIQAWVNEGLIRQSGKTWLITEKFMETVFSNKN